MLNVEQVLANELVRELAREFILETSEVIDETIFESAVIAGKDNWVHIGIIYQMLVIVKENE